MTSLIETLINQENLLAAVLILGIAAIAVAYKKQTVRNNELTDKLIELTGMVATSFGENIAALKLLEKEISFTRQQLNK